MLRLEVPARVEAWLVCYWPYIRISIGIKMNRLRYFKLVALPLVFPCASSRSRSSPIPDGRPMLEVRVLMCSFL